jgi:hypothetical protein
VKCYPINVDPNSMDSRTGGDTSFQPELKGVYVVSFLARSAACHFNLFWYPKLIPWHTIVVYFTKFLVDPITQQNIVIASLVAAPRSDGILWPHVVSEYLYQYLVLVELVGALQGRK